jgi:2-methylcitrate dehydratase PrpD
MPSGTSTASVSAILGGFVANRSYADIPEPLKHQGKRAVLNAFGTALCSARDPAVEGAVRTMSALSGSAEAGLIGRSERLGLSEAAFVNAIAMNLLDFDDTHLPTVIHPTAPVAPVAIALGEARGLSGAAVLAAFVLGAEVECRIGNMVSPGHYARGWHITSTCGAFGAAAAAAKLLGLDTSRTGHALGIAASLSSGIVENLPSAAKNASVGNSARNGILAAYLAAQGYTAAPEAIEGRLGWARASGDEPDIGRALEGLGEAWEFERNAYKPYPCGIVFHAVIDACFELRDRNSLTADEIDHVVVKGDALLLARGDRVVTNERDARVSLHHTAAIVFLYGAAGVAEFEEPCVGATETAAFRARIRGELDASLPSGAATVELVTRDNRTLSSTVLHARGSAERPMTDLDVERKTRRLAEHGSPDCDVGRVIDLVSRLEQLDSVAPLMEAASA